MVDNSVDVEVMDSGSLVGFHPVSQAASDWFDENVESEGWQWLGMFLQVDHRMAQDLIDGLEGEGFILGEAA